MFERAYELRLPGPGEPTDEPVRLRLSVGGSAAEGDRVPLGTFSIGDCSPLLGLDWSMVEVTVNVYSPVGFFPRYRVSATTFTPPDGTPGNLSTTDVGMGVGRIVARAPIVNNAFDYDPSTVPKDVDGEPAFLGTIASLNLGPPHTELFRTRGLFFGNANQFTLLFAVAPQFFTPTGAFPADLELLLEVL